MGEEKKGFFKRLVSGLTKTRDNIVSGMDSIFHGFSKIDDDFYEELEETLIMGDLGVRATMDIIEDLKVKVKEQHIKEPIECRQLVIDSIREQMDVGETAYEFENRQSVVFVIGVNGVGKTTLFKALVGQLPIDHGKIRFGSHVEMAYYDQEHESLNYNKTIFDEISDCYPRMTNQEIRSTLAMFNFRGDDVFKDIAMLSGGERGRVVLTEVLLKQANFLILDEPTNHLDISSKEVLEEALKSFEGTILFISHDRYFINKIATRVIEVQKDQCLSYNGNYDDYLAQKTPVVETTQKVVTKARQRQIIDKKTKNEIKKLERTIDSLEKEINSLKEELTSEEVMNNYKKYNEITDSIDEKEMELMEIMEKWEQLQS